MHQTLTAKSLSSALCASLSTSRVRPSPCPHAVRVSRVSRDASSWAQGPRQLRPSRRAAAGRAAATVSNSTELLISEVRTLEAERETAITTAESCAKTATKLAEMARLLEQLAMDKVRNGDEAGAKQALQEKASVREALDKNSAKADANYQLAAVLASKIAEKQAAVLSAWRASGASASSPPPLSPSSASRPAYSQQREASTSSYASGAAPSSSAGGEPKWQWQQSLEEAKARLRAQEAEAVREGRMARLSAESSVMQAKERIARQAQASVMEGLQRLRASEDKSPGSLEAAQARLRARDEETLAYVRRIMARYRRGDYVSEDELEFAFQQLERRFMA